MVTDRTRRTGNGYRDIVCLRTHSIQEHSIHIMLLKQKFVRDQLTSDNAAVWHQVIAGAHGNNGASTTTKIAMHAGKHGMMDEHGLKG